MEALGIVIELFVIVLVLIILIVPQLRRIADALERKP